ncbi:MAG: hypothetical protein PHV92_06235 [Candidatus Omnitrophica bacterium]|nr:hypothetical protein [Candidatus Omnitrophota bacterium]MDD5519000.1 hypothetical protein [Candidatus Omnitrophota bacterium]
MMKLKISLKNLVKPAPLLVSALFLFLLSGCSGKIEPTYKEKDIPYLIKKICKDEYNLEVTTQRTHNTLWIYAPLNKILHKDYASNEDKIFDDEIMDKIRNIITTIGRVLISSDDTPQFFAFLASDIKLGIDYTMIGCVLDIKKSYADFIPWTEANRRYVIKFKASPEAIGDNTGFHFMAHDIKIEDFLAEQIAQRAGAKFQDEELKKYFKVEKFDGKFSNGVFYFDYSITRTAQSPKTIGIQDEILDTITYCLRTYEFTDFSGIVLTDLKTLDKLELNKKAILSRPNGL